MLRCSIIHRCCQKIFQHFFVFLHDAVVQLHALHIMTTGHGDLDQTRTGFTGDFRTCQFCGRFEPDWDEEKLDLHFWKECPALLPCQQCGQVVEVATLNEHLLTECEGSLPFTYPPPLGQQLEYTGCPLCAEVLGTHDPDVWKTHLLHQCQGNDRRIS